MRLIAIPALLSLAACATPCTPKIETVQVKVPVAAPCVDAKLVPNEPEAVTLPQDARQAAALATAQALGYRAWGEQLRALLTPCVKP